MMKERIQAAVAQAYCFLGATLIVVSAIVNISEIPFWDSLGRILLAFLFYAVAAFIGLLQDEQTAKSS